MDPKQLVKKWIELFNQGNADAQNSLGVMYHEGIGMDPDFSKANPGHRNMTSALSQGVQLL